MHGRDFRQFLGKEKGLKNSFGLKYFVFEKTDE